MMFHLIMGSTQKPVLVIPKGHTEGVTSISFSPNGQYLISGSRDRTAIIWDTSGHQIKSFKHELQVKYARFSIDGNSIYTTRSDSRKIDKKFATTSTCYRSCFSKRWAVLINWKSRSKTCFMELDESFKKSIST